MQVHDGKRKKGRKGGERGGAATIEKWENYNVRWLHHMSYSSTFSSVCVSIKRPLYGAYIAKSTAISQLGLAYNVGEGVGVNVDVGVAIRKTY